MYSIGLRVCVPSSHLLEDCEKKVGRHPFHHEKLNQGQSQSPCQKHSLTRRSFKKNPCSPESPGNSCHEIPPQSIKPATQSNALQKTKEIGMVLITDGFEGHGLF